MTQDYTTAREILARVTALIDESEARDLPVTLSLVATHDTGDQRRHYSALTTTSDVVWGELREHLIAVSTLTSNAIDAAHTQETT